MELNKKRIQRKTGDIYKFNSKYLENEYFQFIFEDKEYLGGDLIRGFVNEQKNELEIKEILDLPIKYYTYTCIIPGYKFDYWDKIGNISIEEDFIAPPFKCLLGDLKNDQLHYYWYLHQPGIREDIFIGDYNNILDEYFKASVRMPVPLINWIQIGCDKNS
jgi:hypothetical protein